MPRPRMGKSRYAPATYAAVALAMVALTVPSALRPPPDEANAAGALNPDAKDPDSILSSLHQAGSLTPGGKGPQPTAGPSPTATASAGPKGPGSDRKSGVE